MAVLAEHREIVGGSVFGRSGTLARLTGDAVMFLFQ